MGRREYLGRGWKLSRSSLSIGGPAPRLGEGNDYVLRQVLGLGPEVINKLCLEGVIGEAPVGDRPPTSIPLEQQVQLGWTVEQDPDYRDFLSRLT